MYESSVKNEKYLDAIKKGGGRKKIHDQHMSLYAHKLARSRIELVQLWKKG